MLCWFSYPAVALAFAHAGPHCGAHGGSQPHIFIPILVFYSTEFHSTAQPLILRVGTQLQEALAVAMSRADVFKPQMCMDMKVLAERLDSKLTNEKKRRVILRPLHNRFFRVPVSFPPPSLSPSGHPS